MLRKHELFTLTIVEQDHIVKCNNVSPNFLSRLLTHFEYLLQAVLVTLHVGLIEEAQFGVA